MSALPEPFSKSYNPLHQDQELATDEGGAYLSESNSDTPDQPMSIDDGASHSLGISPMLHHPPARPNATAVPTSTPSTGVVEDAIAYPQPIPPPSEPKQYRAIGLVRGRYTPSDTQLNRGILLTTDGISLDAVLLGRVISLIKKHLDLEQDHLWVVYPRTRDNETGLHLQIMGVWEPEGLSNQDGTGLNLAVSQQSAASLQDGYFSIRGEVVYQSQDQSYIVVRIRQSPRKGSNQAKTFKLRLEGALPSRAVGYFWNLDVQRQGNRLVIHRASSVGILPPKKVKRTQTRDQHSATKQSNFSKPVRLRDTKPSPPEPKRRSERVEKPIKQNSRSANP